MQNPGAIFLFDIFYPAHFVIEKLKKLWPDFISTLQNFTEKDIILVSEILANQNPMYQ